MRRDASVEGVFRISDFSRLTRVSIKTLRHYGRLGLLTPAFVDPATRYRYYSARQAVRLLRIIGLRDLGLRLSHIAELVEEDPKERRLRRALEARRVELAASIESDRRRLAQLDARLSGLRREPLGPLPEAALRPVPAVRVASLRARVAELDDGVEALFERLEERVARARARAPGPPILIYHDRDHRATHADVEAAVPLVPAARRIPGARRRTLPAIDEAACLVYRGDYGQWGSLVGGLLAWLQARRLAPSGPMREAYLQFSARDPRALRLPRQYLAAGAEDLVTEFQIPVRMVRRPAAIRGRGQRRGRRG